MRHDFRFKLRLPRFNKYALLIYFETTNDSKIEIYSKLRVCALLVANDVTVQLFNSIMYLKNVI